MAYAPPVPRRDGQLAQGWRHPGADAGWSALKGSLRGVADWVASPTTVPDTSTSWSTALRSGLTVPVGSLSLVTVSLRSQRILRNRPSAWPTKPPMRQRLEHVRLLQNNPRLRRLTPPAPIAALGASATTCVRLDRQAPPATAARDLLSTAPEASRLLAIGTLEDTTGGRRHRRYRLQPEQRHAGGRHRRWCSPAAVAVRPSRVAYANAAGRRHRRAVRSGHRCRCADRPPGAPSGISFHRRPPRWSR